ncbi:hypothetical protein PanWU01x14_147690 [Parasponia andersonii]|uniref:Uncharacterized protein n=1 Tax=Parasponia andersonii TaxID=3476 RepID=A0A2P5CJG1_PARAD|nr:hypothetical protein PanWU01x14_147690 [Parasponia andersonii]
MSSFCRRSSMTFRCEFECWVRTNVGLAAGRYSGTSRPDLYLTPQALQSVLGPIGPVRHWGVFSDAQCVHLRVPPLDTGEASLCFDLGFATTGDSSSAVVVVVVVDDKDPQPVLPPRPEAEAAAGNLDRLLLARPENDASFGKVRAPAISPAGKSLKESSTNLDNHSNSATSSLCPKPKN